VENYLDKLKNYKILYCEDSVDLTKTFSMFLKKLTNNIIYAKDGKEGLELYNSKKPDIIITDIEMPLKNGIELIKEIRKVDKEIPIIITTSHDEQRYFLDAIDLGVEKFLIKPIKREPLYNSLSKTISHLEDKKLAEIYRVKEEIEKLKRHTDDVITQFSEILDEPILIEQNSKVKYANDAFGECPSDIAMSVKKSSLNKREEHF